MFVAKIKVQGDATQGLDKLLNLVNDRSGLLFALGIRGVFILKDWFHRRDITQRNRRFSKRTHFWRDVEEAVSVIPRINKAAGTATVIIKNPVIAHKAGIGPNAGDIRPVNAQWLTIPAVEEAYGKTAEEYSAPAPKVRRLIFIRRGEATALLGQVEIKDGTGPKGGAIRGLKIIFVLKKFVHQNPEADALPDNETWNDGLLDSGTRFLEKEMAQTPPVISQTNTSP